MHDAQVRESREEREHEFELAAPTTPTPSIISIDNIDTIPRASNVTPSQVRTDPAHSTAPAPAGVPRSTRATTGHHQTTQHANAFLAKVKTFAKDDGY
jgi:hypothetical protein